MINRTEYIQQYLNRGYSLIPLANNSKKPPKGFKWLQYQNQKASFEDIFKWDTEYNKPNIAIVTGRLSKLVVLDIDDPLLLPELFKQLPEAERTTRVKTFGGYHFYFSHNGNEIKSIKNFLKLGIELQANGRYVVACPSVVEGWKYTFEIPLSKMLPFPIIERKEGYLPKEVVNYKQGRKQGLTYRGKKLACINQIISRGLQVGERTNGLFILYNLLLQNKNSLTYSQKVVRSKNNSLIKPLPGKEVDNIFKKGYKFSCSRIIEELPYVNCESCEFKFKGGKLKMSNILIRNQRKIANLNGSETKVLALLGSYFQGENPSQGEIIRVSGLSKNSVREAIKGLKEKGIE